LTKPENKEFIAKLLDVRVKNPLSPAAMEALAIVAYNHPCTSTLIEEKRTTNSDAAVAKLEALGLIANVGRATTPGRPYLYEVTQKFFNLFGIKSLSELPPLAEQNEDTDLSFFDANRETEE
jgi:segregation and condensation protein B